MPRYIERKERRLTWYATLTVPRDVRRKLGRKRFRKSLGTRDPKVAERLAAPLIAEWQSMIAQARGDGSAENDPIYWRNALAWAKTEKERTLVEHLLQEQVWKQGYDNTDPEAMQFYGRAFGSIIDTTEYLEEWLASLQVRPKTAAMRRSTINRLATKFPILDDINRGEVRRWATELQATLEPATVRRMLSDCRSYWKYLATVGAVSEDSAPFDRLGLKVPAKHRQAWEPAELVRLHRAADETLADLILLAMYSGARLGELVNLRVADVTKDHFVIREAKTAAGRRQVPIHSKIKRPLTKMVKDKTPTDYVLTGIKGKHRADTMSKAFRRLRESQGFTAKQEKTLHSIRNTVITILEHGGVPEGTVQDIVGHQRATITGSTYSGKSTLAMRREALEKLSYPSVTH